MFTTITHLKSTSAIIQVPHEVKGNAIYAYLILRPGIPMSEELERDIRQVVRREVGPFAIPDVIQVCGVSVLWAICRHSCIT